MKGHELRRGQMEIDNDGLERIVRDQKLRLIDPCF